ncbi:MAG TPA: disulfide bond formation protein DsbD [Bacteroidales bacterium]|nr:MAG: hypothetical protein A2W98_09330 [Bacteroidetes bacterium GWF2_33_38]OFY86695.1 MAG: hypothetical protein A2236_14100 [Bacteroidetes bacterium RIFOXYA2_FULL_33_7]HBF87818.1 disulfide bond formation protein DsbD [Bacteroidales bacterium]
MKRLLFISLLFIAINSFAQILEPVKWTSTVKRINDTEAELIFSAKIEENWHLYSQFLPDGGPIPAKFSFLPSKNYEKTGNVVETPAPEVYYDDIFEMNIKQFSKKANFTQKIKILNVKSFKIKVNFEGQACLENGQCVMLGKEFEFNIDGVKKKSNEENPNTDSVNISTINTVVVNDSNSFTTENQNSTISTKVEAKTNPIEESSWFGIFIFAFIAGILTLITPCVFPMIPMTISFFMKGKKSKSEGYKQAYFFGFSIIIIFAVLGLLLTMIFGKDAMYIISTHWIPNMIFFVIFMVFALSFFGMFEITLPNKLINQSDKKADKGGYIGVFFVALTTVLVSFSCTGPILGAALIELSSGSDNSIVFFISMVGFALGFALPFTLLAMFPSILSKLKSGSWLNTVKIVFGFLEIALGLKFLSMADLGANWGLLDRETFLALWIVVFALLGFYLLGKLKFKGDNDLKSISVSRLFLSIVTFSFVIYMIPGLWGAPLKVLSGYLPPLTTQDFDLDRIIYENRGSVNISDNEKDVTRKYADILHLPTGFNGFFDLEEAKAYAKKVNKPLFVDFTGKTCANCREMENNVWNDKEVKRMLNEEFVLVALYADANFIDLEENDWVATEDGTVIKTLGKKNLNYQITRFQMNAQPYYVLMDFNEEILTSQNKSYDKEVPNFINFLNEGLESFKKKHPEEL